MCYKNNKNGYRKYPCCKHMHVFSQHLPENHTPDYFCFGAKPQCTFVAKAGENTLQSTKHHRKMLVHFIIYADFEALNVKVTKQSHVASAI